MSLIIADCKLQKVKLTVREKLSFSYAAELRLNVIETNSNVCYRVISSIDWLLER